MKKLFFLPLLVLLTGCVTYYYPETALEDGVYYAEDDPAYVVYQGGYPGAVYYPWVSLDYFYTGFYPYPRYTYFYGFPFGSSYDYSPWHYPYSYFGYYSPMYASYFYYPHFPAWGPYNGYCSHHGGCGYWSNMDYPGYRHDRHAGNDPGGHRNRDDQDADNEESSVDSPERPMNNGSMYGTPYGRYVSAVPSGYSGNRGMVIRSSETTKIGKSKIQPGHVSPTSNGIVVAAPPSQTTVTSGSNASSERVAPVTRAPMLSSRPPSPPASRAPSASVSSGPSNNSKRASSSRPARNRPSMSPRAPGNGRPPGENHD